jgi:small-conductance mechanosensitive channel
MKMSLENRVVILSSAVVAGLVGWGFLRRPLSTSLLNMLNSDIREFLLGPLFTVGNVPLTPLFLIKCIVFLILLSVFSRLFQNLLAEKILTHTSMDRGHQYAFVRASGYIVFGLGLIIGLDTTGINLRSLLVLGGALGVGIGFGLQSIVANFVAGIVILWEGPIKLGDFIDLGNLSGSTELTISHGEVIRIGARGTWVRTFDNEVMIVPNSEFINNRVANMTADDRSVRLTIPIGVSYDSDLEVVRAALLDIAKRSEYVLPDPPPAVLINGFGDSSVNLSLRVSTARMSDRIFMLKSDLFMEIFRVFREKRIGLPFPSTNQLGAGENATSA